MLEKLLTFGFILVISHSANAAYIVTGGIITAEQLGDFKVSVYSVDNTQETVYSHAISSELESNGHPILNYSGFSDGVVTSSWSLIHEGFSISGIESSQIRFAITTGYNFVSISDIAELTFLRRASVAFEVDPIYTGTPNSVTDHAFGIDILN